MFLFLALSAPPSHAATTLVECTVQVDHADQSWVVAGWGATEQAARHAAWDDARILAELRQDQRFWSQILLGQLDEMGPVETELIVTAVGQPTPGATLTEGACTEQPVADVGRWSVAWGQGPAVERGDPASALSAARQVSCLAGVGGELRDGFRALALASDEHKQLLLDTLLSDALDPVAACWTAAAPTPSVHGADVADAGWYRCSVPSWHQQQPSVGAVGWGASADQADADAQRARVLGEMLAAEGAASRTIAHASAETSTTQRSSALSDWMAAFGSPSDAVRRAGVVCERGQVPADATVAWLPPDPHEIADCGVQEIPASAAAGASPSALQDTVRGRCDAHRDLSHQMVADASASASDDVRPVLVHAGWSVVNRCEAACLGHHQIPDVVWTPVTLDGQPDRTSADATGASVHRAVPFRGHWLIAAPD